ncbi:hypothetical protein HNR00_004956 [Methylorubrum rhodinum]|uniref:Uncharacterized protein n=1 Tax=Methylorubrum rhodinum TaxID=29428 RepID=A0A840ZQ02_9HYPH|nr:type II toxin-antitoxin system HicA family toxin [Methylorubrum rhodinum]MBB5760209.1 hypothetical protein [Methylorubrum rhodinum]
MTDVIPALKKLLRQNGFGFWRSERGDLAHKSRHAANGVLEQAESPKEF